MTYQSYLLRNGHRLNYIYTNVIISFLNRRDVNHARAVKIFEHTYKRVTSPIAVLELKYVLSRTTNLAMDEIEAFPTIFLRLASKSQKQTWIRSSTRQLKLPLM